MRATLLILMVLGAGCRSPDAQGFRRTPRQLEPGRVLHGPAEAGYGHAVAVDDDGTIWVGAPFGPDGGALFRAEDPAVTGEPGDFLGAAVLGGGAVRAGRPGRGAVIDARGAVLAQEPGLGGGLARLGPDVVALAGIGVRGPVTWDAEVRLWSLVVVDLGDGDEVLAGHIDGGLATRRGVLSSGAGARGRGLVVCDLDGEGRLDLVVADPITGRVEVFVEPSLDRLDAPDVVHTLGPGAGMSLACAGRGLAVGAPDRDGGGSVAWLREPLRAGGVIQWIQGHAQGRLGHALAAGAGQLVAGDPSRGEVWELVR